MYLWSFLTYGFLGYLLEKVYALVTRSRHTVRKGYLLLPVCPVYGLAMLAVLIAGIIYVIIHGLHALQSVQRTGEAVSERIALMSDTEGTRHPKERPIFTEPLEVAANRYTQAHTKVDKRKRARRERYARIWSRWASFND